MTPNAPVSDVVMAELKPCPFCGSAPQMEPWHGGAPTKVLISCVGTYANSLMNDVQGVLTGEREPVTCAVSPSVTGETPQEAAEAWNTRATEAAREGEPVASDGRDALVEALVASRDAWVSYGQEQDPEIEAPHKHRALLAKIDAALATAKAADTKPKDEGKDIRKAVVEACRKVCIDLADRHAEMPENREFHGRISRVLRLVTLGFEDAALAALHPADQPAEAKASFSLLEKVESYLSGLSQPSEELLTEVRAALATHPSPEAREAEALWQDLLDKDDRTSPEEYPDMALITFDEFAALVRLSPPDRKATPSLQAESVVDTNANTRGAK